MSRHFPPMPMIVPFPATTIVRSASLHVQAEATDTGDLSMAIEGPLLIPPRVTDLHVHASTGLWRTVIHHVHAHVGVTARNLGARRAAADRAKQQRQQGWR
jgi:hypothetical protein